MKYDLNEEQNMLKDSAHKFLAEECPGEFVRGMAEDEKGFTTELWQKMAELGWMGLAIPEQWGGSGMGFLDLAVLLSEMGYVCLPGPFFANVVLGGLTLVEAGSDEQKADILPGLATGSRILTLALLEEDGSHSPAGIKLSARRQGDHYVLSGTKLFVPYAHVADTIICAGRTADTPDGISLFLVDAKTPGVSTSLLQTMAGDKQCEVVFEGVRVPEPRLLGEIGQGWPILKKMLLMAAVAKSAEMSGGARRVVEVAVQYVKDREQFGRPVGAFQAVQHHCANMLTYADTIRYMAFHAAWRIGSGLPFKRDASMCKAWVSDSYRKLVALGHQVIGGMSFMEEHDMHFYFEQAKTAEVMFGDADFHREMVAQDMGL